jgi:hypothetical protein
MGCGDAYLYAFAKMSTSSLVIAGFTVFTCSRTMPAHVG